MINGWLRVFKAPLLFISASIGLFPVTTALTVALDDRLPCV